MFRAKGRKSMTIRTTRTTVSFSQPFKLKDLDDIQPAGDYILDTDEELIEGLSRLAYRRIATLLHLPSTSRPQSHTEVVSVNPAELAAALESDRIGRA
jgi:molybdopterin-guanine dinucleotide biosynthesis protein